MAPATEPAALIVAHGQPSAPEGPERALAGARPRRRRAAPRLAGGRRDPAAPGALEAALAALDPGPVVVYPHFMTDGWFVRHRIPERLAAAGRADCAVLAPFGRDPAGAALCLRAARDGALAHGLDPAATTLLIAAHGSPSDPRPAAATRAVAGTIAAARVFRASPSVSWTSRPRSPRRRAAPGRRSACRSSPPATPMSPRTCPPRSPRPASRDRCSTRSASTPRCPG